MEALEQRGGFVDIDKSLRLGRPEVRVVPDRENHDFGRFGWFIDPEGNRVELWEPPENLPE